MLPLDRQNSLRDSYKRQRPGWLPASERFAALVRDHLQPRSRVLDLGCGRGGLVEQLEHPVSEVVGLDPDWRSLAEHRLPTMPRAVASSHALPLAGASVDLVLASWVLEHLEQPETDLRQVARVLRPGGTFLFITPNRHHPLIQINLALGRLSRLQQVLVAAAYDRAQADTFPAYYRANTPATLRRMTAQIGLDLECLEAIPDPTYWAVLPAFYPLFRRLEQGLPASWAVHLVGVCRRPVADRTA